MVSKSFAVADPVVFESENCCTCGVVFFVPKQFQDSRKRVGGTFYCPSGHAMCYRESEMDLLRAKLSDQTRVATEQASRALKAENAAKEARTWAVSEQQRAEKERQNVAKLKKRVKAGVCPCCHRTVKQMARHMATKHPDFAS